MKTIIIIGSIFIFILLFALLVTVIGEISTTRRYRRKLADYDLRSKMQNQKQGKEIIGQERFNEEMAEERKNIYSIRERTPAL